MRKVDWRFNMSVYLGFLRKHKGVAFAAVFFLVVLELAMLGQNYLFKVVVDDGTAFAAGTIGKAAFVHSLWAVGALFGCIVLITVAGRWLFMHLINRLEAAMQRDLKARFFAHIIRLSHGFHASHRTGALISRLLRGAGALEGFTDTMLFSFVPIGLQVAAVSVAVFSFQAVTGILVLVIAASYLGYALLINKRQQPYTVAVNDAEDAEKAFVSDTFTNIESVKYFGKESAMMSRFGSVIDNTRRRTVRNWDFWRWLDAGHNAIRGVGLLFIVLLPLSDVIKGTMSIGTLVFIYSTVGYLLTQLNSLTWSIRRMFEAMSNFESLFPYLRIGQEVKDKPGAKNIDVKKGRIVFKDVTFAFKNRIILHRINLVIEPGMRVALVGPSGGGKTTLTKLLYRFYDVKEGSIMIDGHDIRDVKQESLRGSMAIVPQDSVLFNDTLYNNIAFSTPDASRAQVLRAMKLARLDGLVARLPKKERTVVGERGVKLSGGERQRVGIARAILADKRILVLDEATSALDSQTEHDIQADFQRLMQGRTTIIIAHRLSTILSADRIAVVEKGHIVQYGRHQDLVKEEGVYKRLWDLQKGGFIK